MSTQQVILRCDHPGCMNTSTVIPMPEAGWVRVETRVFVSLIMALDYCPNHDPRPT